LSQALFDPRMGDASNSTINRRSRAAVRRLLLLSFALVAVVLLGVGALLAGGSGLLNDLKVKEDQFLIANAVDRINARLVTDTTSVTAWNQAYTNLRPGGDAAWQAEEIGAYLHKNRGFDRSVALDGRNAPFFAWTEDHSVEPAGQAQFVADAAPLIRQVRGRETARSLGPAAARADPTRPITAMGIIVSGGTRYLVGASTVTPSRPGTPVEAGPAVMVIAAQALDGRVLNSLVRMRVNKPRVVDRSPGPASVPLLDPEGRAVGYIAWTPLHPGLAALRTAAPLLSLGLLSFAAVMAVLVRQMWRITRELDSYERAHEAALKALEDARDRAEGANVAKSQFLANMSHEIRTPLNGVLGMAQVLALSDLPAEARDRVAIIRNSGETLLGLLNDVLDLSKIEAGRMELSLGTFDLAAAAEGAMRAFASAAAGKGVAFLVEIDPQLAGHWRGDAGKIRQVLGNLASNAVKFTTEGEVCIALRRTPAGVIVTVADTGVGIPGPELARLFRRFSQIDPSATRRFGGTGLGLAISRELIELMGGSISVASVEGRGSTFTVELPLQPVAPTHPEPLAAVDVAAPVFRRGFQGLRVLAAEDNRINQVLLSAMLDPLGVDLHLASDGRDALARFVAQDFDLVLMDIQMPGMNGVDAAQAIRALELADGRAPTPILALSANVMRHQVEAYLAAGMNGFVSKPIAMANLVEAMEAALTAQLQAAQA
jgi:signal transduction histidine kinase/CheY-like chemotaxis protein